CGGERGSWQTPPDTRAPGSTFPRRPCLLLVALFQSPWNVLGAGLLAGLALGLSGGLVAFERGLTRASGDTGAPGVFARRRGSADRLAAARCLGTHPAPLGGIADTEVEHVHGHRHHRDADAHDRAQNTDDEPNLGTLRHAGDTLDRNHPHSGGPARRTTHGVP